MADGQGRALESEVGPMAKRKNMNTGLTPEGLGVEIDKPRRGMA